MIRNLVEEYRGAEFEQAAISQHRILCLQVTNELEHDQRPSMALSQDDLGVGLIREAKYGSPVSLARWQEAGDQETPGSESTLFDVLIRSTTAAGDTLTDFDPAVVPAPLSPGSAFENTTVYRPFRKASTSSFFSDVSTPLQVSRSNSWLPSSEPAKPSSSSSSAMNLGSNTSRPIASLTASGDAPGGDAEWKTFTKSGFGSGTEPIGLRLGDAFEEKRPDQVHGRDRDLAIQSLGKQSTNEPLSPTSPGSVRMSSRRKKRDVTGIFTINELQARDVSPAFLAFLKDAEIDQEADLYPGWPVLLIMQTDDAIRATARLKGDWIVISGTRYNLPLPPAPLPPPPVEKRPLPASPNVVPSQSPSTISASSSKRVKTYRRTSLFGMLSMGSKPKSPPSGSESSPGLERSPSAGLQPLVVNEMGQIERKESAGLAITGADPKASQRPRAASYTSRKQVPGMLDDVKVESSSSLSPSEGIKGTAISPARNSTMLQSPVEITASDSKGNLVDIQHGDAIPLSASSLADEGDAMNPPQTPTSTLQPGTPGFETDVAMSTPQRGRRSAAPSPDSALVDPVISRSTTPEPMYHNADQPSELPAGITDLSLSEPSASGVEMSPPRAEGFVQLGAALPITSSPPSKLEGPSVVASSVLEEEDSAASVRTPPTFVRALVVSSKNVSVTHHSI